MRKTLIAGNWKMNKTPSESIEFVTNLIKNIGNYNDREILICPPFTSLYPISDIIRNSSLLLGAQNVFYEEKGAFTGEISPLMLKDIGVEYVICGHSERRNIFGEIDEIINKKVKKVIQYKLKPILCIGEKLEERESNKTFDIIKKQLEKCLSDFEYIEQLTIAYEPVWAIGTGKNATPQQAQDVHRFIRKLIEQNYGQSASCIRILYGGSVKPENIDILMAEADIDGALVGGASLKIESFSRIVGFQRI